MKVGEDIYLTPREKNGINFATFCSRGAWSSEKYPPDLVRKCVDETQTPGVQLLFPCARLDAPLSQHRGPWASTVSVATPNRCAAASLTHALFHILIVWIQISESW